MLHGSNEKHENLVFATRVKNRSLPPNLTRSVHKKSRNGCYSCKARRLKCDECKPCCGNCFTKGTQCSFPADFKHLRREYSSKMSSLSITQLAAPTTARFSMEDMQALHHFLVLCPPALPIGNRNTWVGEIPQLARHRPCLMDAILALGSSHRSSLTGYKGGQGQALQRRGQALRGLSDLVTHSVAWSIEDTDTALAICYALTFQASYMSDGLDDYLVMVNGCKLITEHVRKQDLPTHFDVSLRRMQSKLEETTAPIMRGARYEDLLDEAAQAFQTLKEHIQDPAELRLWTSVEMILRSFDAGACVGVLNSLDMYGLWYQLAGPHLRILTRANHGMSLVLLAYFMSVQLIYRILLPCRWFPILVRSFPPGQYLHEVIDWLDAFLMEIPQYLQRHLHWVRSIVDRIPTELIGGFIALSMGNAASSVKAIQVSNVSQSAHVVLGDILRVTAELAAWQEKLFEKRVNNVLEVGNLYGTTCFDETEMFIDANLPPYSIVPHNDLPRMVAEINDLMRNEKPNDSAYGMSSVGINVY